MNIIQKLIDITLKNRFYKWSRKRIERYQKRRIRRITSFAKRKSIYYKELNKHTSLKNFLDFPVMIKQEMVDNLNEINTRGLNKDNLFAYGIEQEKIGEWPLYKGKFTVSLSSGTSGSKTLSVASRLETILYHSILFSRSGIPEEINPKRVLFTLRANSPLFMEMEAFDVHIFYMDYTHTIDELIETINLKKLNILAGPPSLLELIAKSRKKITQKINLIISYAEVLNELTKKKLISTFNIPIIEIYHGTEGFFASTCREGKLHLNEDLLFFEFLDAGDTLGNAKNLIITDLFRKTQPMIRYQVNDIVEVSEEKCRCGSSFTIISKIHGRADDAFLLKNQEGVTRYLFPDYVRRSINQASNEILEYQAIQIASNKIEIRLVLRDKTSKDEIHKKILENLSFWAEKIDANLGDIVFSKTLPKKNPVSQKLIRVIRRI